MVLGAVTWVTCHTLDPYRSLSRLGPNRPIPAGVKPLEVDVVALDWKWLFIYPELGVASVNELAAPVDRPLAFKITASTVMNSLAMPAIAGQIYAMPGMQTQLHAVINQPGVYDGFSGNYSGAGFSGMRFKVRGLSDADFATWAANARAGDARLTREAYVGLTQPSQNQPVSYFASVDPGLFLDIVDQCAASGDGCKRGDAMHAAMKLAVAEKVLCGPDGKPLPPRQTR
jgi:cytochrome o ubiquinol oxidase subunit 2